MKIYFIIIIQIFFIQHLFAAPSITPNEKTPVTVSDLKTTVKTCNDSLQKKTKNSYLRVVSSFPIIYPATSHRITEMQEEEAVYISKNYQTIN